jgi:mannose-6-phosphate isomerase class I
MDLQRPYLIIPKLILQPTWGGRYIVRSKGWGEMPQYNTLAIGQVYELFSGSKLVTDIVSTSSPEFLPELGNPDSDEVERNNPHFYSGSDHFVLTEVAAQFKDQIVGPKVWEHQQKMPLLVKLNQAKGNSFQLHLKFGESDEHWQSKPESWYYFEDGLITYGLKPGIDLKAYKQTCEEIANFMQQLSQSVTTSQLDLDEAKNQAKNFIKKADPWKFVNKLNVYKDEVIDLSSGGIHHSWEEDAIAYPYGNIVYEVQYDVMDPVCTIRAFDQGKIREDGTVRKLHIDDYFAHIDTDEHRNNPNEAKQAKNGETLLATQFYSLDKLQISEKRSMTIADSFEHLYVKEGLVTVRTDHGQVEVGKGHSAFVPFAAGSYEIVPTTPSTILRTYITAK